MGQETSLNCRSSGKPQQHEIQTTHANAIHLINSRNTRPEGQGSDLRSKKSATTHLDNQSSPSPSSFALSTASQPRAGPSLPPAPTRLPSHENLLRVSLTPFPNAERSGTRYHERPGKPLAQIVQSRYNTTMHFPLTQAVLLVESLIYSLRYLEKEAIPHHDFYPTNVHYHNGKFKISNPLGVEASAYTLTHQRKRFSFLAPQLISQLLNDTPQGDIPEEIMLKADIFAIGMMALEFCTLQPSAQCYDEENYSIVDKIIKDRLVKVAKLYSPNIADCIAEMLRYEVEERISVEELALLVFLNSQSEKIDPPPQEKKAPLPPPPPQRQYQQNPPYVQQQYLILPPGAPPPPAQQPLPLGQNSIALPTPNYAYTRIGPNNQGLLSPTTLTNKLKVIQLIHQKPQEEEESEGQMSSLPSNMLPTISSEPTAGYVQRQVEGRQNEGGQSQYRQGDHRLLYALPQTQTQQRVVTNPNQYSSVRKEQSTPPPLPQREPQIRQQYKPQTPRIEQRTYQPPSRQYSSRPERPTEQPRSSRPSYQPNKFLSKTDQNGQTLEQRVERILQMSRSIQ